MQNVILTLYSGLGADLGPNFTLSANVGSVNPNTSTRVNLLAGVTVEIDDLATDVDITSVGICTNSISLSLTTSSTSTSTTSTTTTTSTTSTTSSTSSTTTSSTTSSTTSTTTTLIPIVDTYGYMYNWMVVPTIANTGWNVPSLTIATDLITYLGGGTVAGGKLKEVGTSHWLTPNTGATDDFGFTARPAPSRSTPDGTMAGPGSQGTIWLLDAVGGDFYRNFTLGLYNSASANTGAYDKHGGFSIRLIKNTPTAQPDGTIISNGYTGNDNKTYDTVVINGYEWLTINLKETKTNTGVDIPEVQDDTAWSILSTGARCYYVI